MNKKIGLFGYGCVGQGLQDVLENSKGYRSDIGKIVVKDKTKTRRLPASSFNYDANLILEDSNIDLVLELIDNADEAFDIVRKALANGKSVVSANKKMIAENLQALYDLQRETGNGLLYEASVCGSIPIIRTLEEYFDNESLLAVGGIFNGSSNYILTKVIDEGLDYTSALAQAQAHGFAESDPTLDVGGFDAKYKLVIAAAHAYGVFINPNNVFNFGIQNLTIEDIQYAKENDFTIKLLASSRKLEDKHVTAFVTPSFIKSDDPLSNVKNEYNGVIVEAQYSEKQVFIGKGAGGHPTGSAVLSDISANSFDYKYEYKKHQVNKTTFTNNIALEVYVRYNENLLSSEPVFEEIIERGNGFVRGKIKLSELIARKDELERSGAFLSIIGEPEIVHTTFKKQKLSEELVA